MLPTNSTWSDEIKTLKEFNCHFTDTLEVKNNRLVLTKGNFRSSSYYPLKNAPLVAKHIETLISKTANSHFETLKATNDYEKISEFTRDLKLLKTQLSALEYRLRSFKKENTKKFSTLFDKAKDLLSSVNQYKKTQPKPETRIQQNITYTERTSLSSIKRFYPKRVPLESTLNAAKTALRLGKQDTKWRSFWYVAGEIGKIALIALGMIPATYLTLLKFIVWNPIEYGIRGEIQTRNPFQILGDLHPFYNTHRIAYQLYSQQILSQPIISKEVVKAFKELAPHAEELYLSQACIVVDNESELNEFNMQSFNGIKYPYPITRFTRIDDDCRKQNASFNNHFNKKYNVKSVNNESIDDDKIPDHLLPSKMRNFISKSHLLELFEIAKKSPTCKEINISFDLEALEFVPKSLETYGYKKPVTFLPTYKR